MYKVYVLYSRNYNKIYIGYTGNLKQRLMSHNVLSHKGYTKRFRPWEIAFYEEYNTKQGAMAREKFLKTGQGRKYVWAKVRRLYGLPLVER